MVIEVPEELKVLGEAMRDLITMVGGAMKAAAGGKAVDYARVERDVAEQAAAIERAAHRGILHSLDVDREYVMIGGERHTRVGRSDATYYTLAGPVVVTGRALYRRDGERNGKVVDAELPPLTVQAISQSRPLEARLSRIAEAVMAALRAERSANSQPANKDEPESSTG